jgi:hypothetical protein
MADIEDLDDNFNDNENENIDHEKLDNLFKGKKKQVKKQDEPALARIPDTTEPNIRTSEIISASRRTDIPAFYMDQFLQNMKDGIIDVPNPNSNQISHVSLKSEDIKCIIWWSKDYHNWIETYKGNKELFDKYKHIFNFTINGYDELENGLQHTLDERLDQLKYLAETFGSNTIKYRFDPIVYYKIVGNDAELNNLQNFEKIIQFVGQCGVRNCQFAFCLSYKNVERRMKFRNKTIVYLSLERQHEILNGLIDICDKNNVTMYSCCNSGLVGYSGKIKQSACVDRDQIEEVLRKKLKSRRKDCGQRKECGCVQSRDVGSYKMKCHHNCDYCYAAR